MLEGPWNTVILACVLTGFFALEKVSPLRKRTRPLVGRLRMNITITALAFMISMVTVKPVTIGLIGLTGSYSFGLLQWLPFPGIAGKVVAFLLLDMTFYWWHRANHLVPLLWRLHSVHHCDPDLDVSTSFRFHAVEILLSTGFRAIQISLIAPGLITCLVYEFVFTCATMFHHSNLRMPVQLERALNMLFVTPRMHGIHHSGIREETDSDYSVIFRWWDWMFGSLKLNVPQSGIVIGVPGYSEPADNAVIRLFAMPFVSQKPYWVRPDGTIPSREYTKDSKIVLN